MSRQHHVSLIRWGHVSILNLKKKQKEKEKREAKAKGGGRAPPPVATGSGALPPLDLLGVARWPPRATRGRVAGPFFGFPFFFFFFIK
jgi:hypothetical protein